MRVILLVCLLAGLCEAHGGVFRPPPRLRPGDVFTPKKGGIPTTKAEGRATPLDPWEYWWRLNRGAIMRLRQRILERTVVTGKRTGKDLFDRAALRDRLIPVMKKALRDTEQAVRTAAAVALGKFMARDAGLSLRRVFRNDNIRQVREAALMGLMLMRDPEHRDFFLRIIKSERESRRVRGLAVLALGFLKDRKPLLELMSGRGVMAPRATKRELAACATVALGFCGAPVVAPLIEAARNPKAGAGVRGYAGSALARLGNPLALPDMVELVRDADALAEARYGAAIAVGRLARPGDAGVIDTIGRKAQRDKDRGVRALLLLSLGRIGGERAVTYIVGGMNKAERGLRGFHLLALGMSGWKDAGSLLMEQWGSLKSATDRGACALAMGLCGYAEGGERIRKELGKQHPGFMQHGLVAVGLLNDRKAVPVVSKILTEVKQPMVRREGAVALALLLRGAAIPKLLELMKRSKSTLSRGAVAAALGIVGTERVVGPLLKVYNNKRLNDEERAVALAALGRIADPEPLSLLRRLSEDLNPYVLSEAVAELLTIL